MNQIAALLHHIPDIERKIEEHDLDALVLGLGPSAYLAPWIDNVLLRSLSTWGSHDVDKVLPVDDLLLIDSPTKTSRLFPGTAGYEQILKARPRRLWIYDKWREEWDKHLPQCVQSIARSQPFFVWGNPKLSQGLPQPKHWVVGDNPPHCGGMSPIACVTLAWQEGCRRIGVLGVDVGPDHKHTHRLRKDFDSVLCQLASSAHEQGGCVVNLSPITCLTKFASWKPSSAPPSSPPESGATSAPPSSERSSGTTSTGAGTTSAGPQSVA